jgi:hypothetical protein
MSKANTLTGIILASIIALISFPLYIILYVDPAFVNLVTSTSEREAVKVANYIALTLFPEAKEYNATALSAQKEQQLLELQHEFQIIKVKIFKPDGTVIYSTDKADVGQINTHDYFLKVVAQGQVYTKVVQKNTISMEGQTMPVDVVETYVPIMHGLSFAGAFEIYYDNTEPRNELRSLLRKVTLSVILMTAGLLVNVLLASFGANRNLKEKNAADLALRKAHDELEDRVSARTRELTQANEALNQEITTRRAAEAAKEQLIMELTDALAQVKTLTGLLPICSSCRQIRDHEGAWSKIEEYIQNRTDAEFTHGICPKCAKRLYPDLYDQLDDSLKG